MKLDLKNAHNWGSTWIGALVAVANAWLTIDWDNFDFKPQNCMKLGISGVIALGGYMTSINTKK